MLTTVLRVPTSAFALARLAAAVLEAAFAGLSMPSDQVAMRAWAAGRAGS